VYRPVVERQKKVAGGICSIIAVYGVSCFFLLKKVTEKFAGSEKVRTFAASISN